MSTLRQRFGQTNAPESMKRGLIKDRLTRARLVEAFTIAFRIDFRGIVEGGTYAEQVDGETPARKVLWAKANDIVKGRLVGNGLDAAWWRWKTKLLDDITIGQGDEAIHLAVVEATERRPKPRSRKPWKQKVYVVHKPTKRATNKALRPIVDQTLREHTRRDDKAGIPWVILTDANGALDIGVELGSHGPDHIRASKHFEPLGQKVIRRPGLSDHYFLIADAAVEV